MKLDRHFWKPFFFFWLFVFGWIGYGALQFALMKMYGDIAGLLWVVLILLVLSITFASSMAKDHRRRGRDA